MQIPSLLRLPQSSKSGNIADRLSIIGCYFFLFGLGLILSTYKRKVRAPLLRSHQVGIQTLYSPKAAALGVLFICRGLCAGRKPF